MPCRGGGGEGGSEWRAGRSREEMKAHLKTDDCFTKGGPKVVRDAVFTCNYHTVFGRGPLTAERRDGGGRRGERKTARNHSEDAPDLSIPFNLTSPSLGLYTVSRTCWIEGVCTPFLRGMVTTTGDRNRFSAGGETRVSFTCLS